MSAEVIGNKTQSINYEWGGYTVVDKTSSDASWSIPAGVTSINVLIIGGGGGGGGGGAHETSSVVVSSGGGGGGGGAALLLLGLDTSYWLNSSKTVPIVIGAGGAGGAAKTALTSSTVGNNGSSGGTSSFGLFSASGGSGGLGGDDAPGSTYPTLYSLGGAGGSTVAKDHQTPFIANSVTTSEQFFDLLHALGNSETQFSVTITGGTGGNGGYRSDATTPVLFATTGGASPTFSNATFTTNYGLYSLPSSLFPVGSRGASGDYVAATKADAGTVVSGFAGGGGGGGGTTRSYSSNHPTTSQADEYTAQRGGNAGPGAGSGSGIFRYAGASADDEGDGGAAAANSGGGGGGGAGHFNGSSVWGSVSTSAGGAGGSGRVIIWYRTV